MQEACRAGRKERARRETKRYFGSHAAKVVALQRASRKSKLHWTAETLNLNAEQLDPWVGADERVTYRTREKAGGGVRVTCRYGVRNRALQYMVARVVDAHTPELPGRFDKKGRGRNAAAVMIAALILRRGITHAVIADIQNCYPSFDAARLPELLPLPDRVVRSVISQRPRNLFSTRRTRHVPQYGYRRSRNRSTDPGHWLVSGLPQGSAASPFVERYLLGSALSSTQGAYSLAFADDYACLSTGVQDACAVQYSLHAYFDAHPAGPFVVRSQMHRVSQGCEFLGYRFKAVSTSGHRDCYVDLSRKSFRKLYRKLCVAAEIDARNGNPDTPRLRIVCQQQFAAHSSLSWGDYAEMMVRIEVSAEIASGGRRIRSAVRNALETAKRSALRQRFVIAPDLSR